MDLRPLSRKLSEVNLLRASNLCARSSIADWTSDSVVVLPKLSRLVDFVKVSILVFLSCVTLC